MLANFHRDTKIDKNKKILNNFNSFSTTLCEHINRQNVSNSIKGCKK